MLGDKNGAMMASMGVAWRHRERRAVSAALGPLPAGLNTPFGVAFAADGEMLIIDEDALLRVR